MKKFSVSCIIFCCTLIICAATSAHADGLAAPTTKGVYYYDPVATPFLSASQPENAKPVGVGALAQGGDLFTYGITTPGFTFPADVYLLILAPSISPNPFFFNTANVLVDAPEPWKKGSSGENVTLLNDLSFSASSLPPGDYYFGLAALPAGGDFNGNYYLWYTKVNYAGGSYQPTGTGSTTALSVTPMPDEAGAKTVTLDGNGGVLSLGYGGVVYTLTVPPNALTESTDITIKPITGLAGAQNTPLAGGLLAGLQVSPEELFFHQPVTLTFTMASAPASDQTFTFGYLSDGENVHLYPSIVHGNEVRFRIGHSGGYGLASGGSDAVAQQRAHVPTTWREKTMQNIAGAIRDYNVDLGAMAADKAPLMHKAYISSSAVDIDLDSFLAVVKQELDKWWIEEIFVLLSQAVNTPDCYFWAGKQFIMWWREVEFFGFAEESEIRMNFKARIDSGQTQVAQALKVTMDDAAERCDDKCAFNTGRSLELYGWSERVGLPYGSVLKYLSDKLEPCKPASIDGHNLKAVSCNGLYGVWQGTFTIDDIYGNIGVNGASSNVQWQFDRNTNQAPLNATVSYSGSMMGGAHLDLTFITKETLTLELEYDDVTIGRAMIQTDGQYTGNLAMTGPGGTISSPLSGLRHEGYLITRGPRPECPTTP